ncbi:MAG: alpha/beta hydrolase family protein [Candidatus Bruticola sp.]
MGNYLRIFFTSLLGLGLLSSPSSAWPNHEEASTLRPPKVCTPDLRISANTDYLSATSDQSVQVRRLPSQKNIQIEEWTYPSGKLKVKGRLYLPPKEGQLPLVIFNHDGISGISKYHELSSLRLASQGWAVFSPSYRGEDGSEGEIEIAKGETDDVLNAFRLLRARPNIDKRQIYFMGASHGALISLLAAARLQPNDIQGLIFAYGVADIYSWWDYLKEVGKLGNDPITKRTYGDGPQSRPLSFSMRHGLTAAAKLQIPVLILQGGLDDITPPEQGQVLARTLKANSVSCKFLQYPNCLHGFLVYAPYIKKGVSTAERQETEQAWQEVFNFLRHGLEP